MQCTITLIKKESKDRMTIVNDKDINRVNGADENYVEEIDTMSREYLSDWFGVVFSLNTS